MKVILIFLLLCFINLIMGENEGRDPCFKKCGIYWNCFGKAKIAGRDEKQCTFPVNCDCFKFKTKEEDPVVS